MSLKRAAAFAVLAACLWAGPSDARAQEDAGDEAPPAPAAKPRPVLRAPPGPVRAAPQWRQGPQARPRVAGRGLYDPVNGYFYLPGSGGGQVTITLRQLGQESQTIYLQPPAGGRMPPQYYWNVIHAMRTATPVRRREAPAVAAPPEQAPAVAPPRRPAPPARLEPQPGDGQFPSRLSPMLGGPEGVSLLFALGEAKLRLGRFGEAVPAFQRCSDDEPANAQARMGLALAMVGIREPALAAEQLRRALDAMPDLSLVVLDLEGAFSSPESYAAAVDHLASLGGDADARLMLAFHHFITGDGARAAELLTDTGEDDAPVVRLRAAARERGAPVAEPVAE